MHTYYTIYYRIYIKMSYTYIIVTYIYLPHHRQTDAYVDDKTRLSVPRCNRGEME